jgi:hypothetical protein
MDDSNSVVPESPPTLNQNSSGFEELDAKKVYDIQKKVGVTFTMEDVSTTTKLVELDEGGVGLKVAKERLNCDQ